LYAANTFVVTRWVHLVLAGQPCGERHLPPPARLISGRQPAVCSQTMAMTAGIAAARVIRQGIAAHTSSLGRLCPERDGVAAARRVLQIARNMAANMPVATREHIPRRTSRIG